MRNSIAIISVFFLFGCAGENKSDHDNQTLSTAVDTTSLPEIADTLIDINNENSEEDEVIPVPHLNLTDKSCLPMPNPRFIRWIKTDSLWAAYRITDEFYGYLLTHFDSLSSRKPMDENEIEYSFDVAWEQQFSGGFTFSTIEWLEAGIDHKLETECTDISQVRKVFRTIIHEKGNVWNQDSTSYSPDGAGCGYEFETEKDSTITISWYCGC